MSQSAGLLPRVISLIPVAHGEMTRTKHFIPDYAYTSQFLDLTSFDEASIINVGGGSDEEWRQYTRFVTDLLQSCFLPVTLGGGLASIDQVAECMDLGADRVLIGSAAITSTDFVEAVAERWGAQAVIVGLSVRRFDGELFVVSSRLPHEPSAPALDVAARLQRAGVGEFFINSVDRDGSLAGIDFDAAEQIASQFQVPFVVAGGVGNWKHIAQAIAELGANGVATSNIYHLTSDSVSAAKAYLMERGIPVRMIDSPVKEA